MARNSAAMLIMSALCLCALGLVMLLSVGAFSADNKGNSMYFVTRQGIWLVMSLVVCWTTARVDYHRMVRFAPWMIGVSGVLVLACFIPHIGMMLNGAHRWLRIGPVPFRVRARS